MSTSWSKATGIVSFIREIGSAYVLVLGMMLYGQLYVVPRGVEHCPLAETDDTHVVLIEPKTTLNTGNVRDERTVDELDRI